MKTLAGIVLILFAGLLSVNAQGDGLDKKNTITFFNSVEDYSYQFNVSSFEIARISCSINVRLEDELTSEETYKLFEQVSFFDVSLAYTLNAFEFSMGIENLLGFNNNNFAIEPNLEQGNSNMENILFTHEADFLVSARIAYNF